MPVTQPTEADLALDLPTMLWLLEDSVNRAKAMGAPFPPHCLEIETTMAILRRAIAAEAEVEALRAEEVVKLVKEVQS